MLAIVATLQVSDYETELSESCDGRSVPNRRSQTSSAPANTPTYV
jgi:hypothetical protein